MIHPSLIFFCPVQHSRISLFLDVSMFLLVQRDWLGIAQESRTTQASPRVDVDEAPYAPGNDLLSVTELEDAHDPIKLRNPTIILNSSSQKLCRCPILMELLDSATRLVWMIRTLLNRSPVSCQFENEIPSVRKSSSRTQQCSASGWS